MSEVEQQGGGGEFGDVQIRSKAKNDEALSPNGRRGFPFGVIHRCENPHITQVRPKARAEVLSQAPAGLVCGLSYLGSAHNRRVSSRFLLG